MTHYFTDNRELKHNLKEVSFYFDDNKFSFITDNGVFSKGEVDYGSYAFLKVLINQDLDQRILDLGCGYGTIGICLKHHFKESEIVMADVNPRAVELSAKNSQLNGVETTVVESDVYSNIDGTFTDIVTNPPIRAGKDVVHKIFVDGYNYLNEGGCLWVVIRKQQGAQSAISKIKELYGNCEIVARDSGYYMLRAFK